MDFTDINHLLELARMTISEKEKENLSLELDNILNYVRQLQEINTEGIEPLNGGTFFDNVTREDEINPSSLNLKKEGYFRVPYIFD